MLKRIILVLLAAVAGVVWLLWRGTPPPQVPVVSPERQNLVSTLTTNGRVEPASWSAVHAEAGGTVRELRVSEGQSVRRGQILAVISDRQARADVDAARSRVRAAQAEAETLSSGGSATERAEIESGIARARAEISAAQREIATLERLVQKQAATSAELTAARESLRRAELQVQSLERRRRALVTPQDQNAAQARLAEARSGLDAASRRIADFILRSPADGILYSLSVRQGDFVQPGTLAAKVGTLHDLKVTVFVDEPELGRVAKGMPVTITWDAMPGRKWEGSVISVPLEVVAEGTRQVGEVICRIDNPDLTLIPGTNVNAEIRSREVANALTIPKEALRRTGGETGVYVADAAEAEGYKVVWRKVTTGISSVTRVEVTSGLTGGEKLVLPVDAPLKPGDTIRPVAAGAL